MTQARLIPTQRMPDPDQILADFCTECQLSPRETQVFQMICTGLKNTAIATHLGISSTTVRLHITNIHRKMDTQSKVDLVLRLWRYSLQKHCFS